MVLRLAAEGLPHSETNEFVAPDKGLTVVFALIHASFFGLNCQGIHHWLYLSHLSYYKKNTYLLLLQSKNRFVKVQWTYGELNPKPSECKSDALAN